ncbi:MAG TPA: proton-conducting transporter membrane subunit [Acidimicrobiales bacterium]|nr:proton-conducting transporter membrane subunit [Acidimicrobiales bacterium]HUX03721.1 proton-conducting transporter membrane subunit [Acidimicrobiales bacterium]
MTTLEAAVAILGALGVGAAAFPVRARVVVAALFTILASLCALVVGIYELRTGHVVTVVSHSVIPVTGIDLRLDAMGAVFVSLTAVVAIAASVFTIGYAQHHSMSRSAAGAFPLFVVAMLLVPAAWSVMTFMALWEVMALASLVLVLSDYRRSESVRSAGLWYAVLTHVGAAAIALGLLLLAGHAGGQGFDAIISHSATMSSGLRGLVFVLLFAGFASKAGAVPLHVWLPRAHAEAPSAVSALMSAAMVNLGIYGVLRAGDTLLGGGPAWWWIMVIVTGAVSAIYGSIHAATSTDLKRLLAYSTTDNIGLVFIAIGTAGLLSASGSRTFAALALFAGLFHLVNHSIFKGTLFLSAGSIQYTTGTRNLDSLGGLLSRMPVASTIFAVGSVAISALPPLGGFVSEWILLQSLLHGLSNSTTVTIILMPLSVAALALTGGLTAAAFVKAFGVGFLGIPRSEAAERVVEPPRLMNFGAGTLGLLCVVLGLAPMVVIKGLSGAVRSAQPGSGSAVDARGVAIALRGAHGVFEPTLIALALGVAILLVGGLRWLLSRRLAVRRAPAWGCGRELQTARMTYTATSFAEPLQRIFDDIVQPSRDLDVSHREESRYFVESVRFGTRDADAFERTLYRPTFAAVRAIAHKARLLQNGSIHRYLGYGLAVLVIILVVAR